MKLLGKCLLAILLIASCNGALSLFPEPERFTEEVSINNLKIGDIGPFGGVIFDIGGDHVMEAISVAEWDPQIWTPKTDAATPASPWCTGLETSGGSYEGSQQLGASLKLGDGFQATREVIKRIDWNLNRYSSFGIEFEPCRERINVFKWVINAKINGVIDWYIPTSYELKTLTSFELVRDNLKVNIGSKCRSHCRGTYLTSTINESGNLIFWDQFNHKLGTYSGYPGVVLVRKSMIDFSPG